MELLISGSYNVFSDGYNAAGIYLASGLIESESYSRPIYVGSAVNMKNRIVSQHIPKLTCLDHKNKPMQSYAAKYGIENLVWFALETHELKTIPAKDLIPLEQNSFDELQPFIRLRQGFNICEKAGSTAGQKLSEKAKARMSEVRKGKCSNPNEAFKKTFTLISPLGKTVIFTGLNEFCKQNDLDRANIYKVLKGKQKSHKGWRLT